MEPRSDTLGRWLRDVFVTLVLLFAGIGVSVTLTAWIAPRSATVYMVSLLVSLIPTGIWLRHCDVMTFGTRAEFVTYLLSAVAYGVFIDLLPEDHVWLGFVAIIVVRPVVQRLVERSPLLAGVKRDASD